MLSTIAGSTCAPAFQPPLQHTERLFKPALVLGDGFPALPLQSAGFTNMLRQGGEARELTHGQKATAAFSSNLWNMVGAVGFEPTTR